MNIKIPPHYKKYLTRNNLVIGGVALVIGLYVYNNIFAGKKKADNVVVPTVTGASSSITVNTEPNDLIRPNSTMIVEGSFLDKNGNVTTVPRGYYYIFRDTGLSTGYQYVYGNTLGTNVSNYRVTVPTTYFQDGSYEVVVSDEPLPDSALGTGKFANPPYNGGTTFKDTTNVIKNGMPGFRPSPMFPDTNRVNPQDMTAINRQLPQDLSFQ